MTLSIHLCVIAQSIGPSEISDIEAAFGLTAGSMNQCAWWPKASVCTSRMIGPLEVSDIEAAFGLAAGSVFIEGDAEFTSC